MDSKSRWVSRNPRSSLPVIVLTLTVGFLAGIFAARTLSLLRDVQLSSQLWALQRGASSPVSGVNKKNPDDAPAAGHLHDSFIRQGLSHRAFHRDINFKLRLAALVRQHNEVGVVGVEHGAETIALFKDGYVVNAFEPHPVYYAKMAKRVANSTGFRLHNVAIGPERGTYRLEYREFVKQVPMAPLTDFIHAPLDLLSVDVQGHYPGVIKSAAGLDIRSMWIEIFACNNLLPNVLHQLDQQYHMFDFVPFGGVKDGNKETPLSQLGDNVEWSQRPSDLRSYVTWFCDVKKKHFNWLQTDIVAIRRDALTPSILNKLATIGNDAYTARGTAN